VNDLFTYAQGRRERGMGLAADAEDRAQPEFAEVAFTIIRALAERQETVHVDDVLARCHLKPHHPNAWGAVWMRAIRERLIAHSGMVRPCRTDTKKNAHQYPVYHSLVKRHEPL
jgi:hypothetical protein